MQKYGLRYTEAAKIKNLLSKALRGCILLDLATAFLVRIHIEELR